jgi:hypothetical protein
MDEPQGFIDVEVGYGREVPLTIETSTFVRREKLAENIRGNLERGVSRFASRPGFGERRNEPLAIVGAGPSLKKTIEQVRGFKNILVCGSAHDYLVRQGIVPSYALVADAGVDDKDNLGLKQRDTTYLIASQCDPGLFDHLEGYPVEMWHYRGQAVDIEDEPALLNNEPSLGWGSTVTLVAVDIALGLGFQHFHFFGFDSSYGAAGEHHCAPIHGSLELDKNIAKVGDKEFVVDKGLMVQAEQFFKLVIANGKYFHSTIYGDGLIAAMTKACIDSDPAWAEYMSVV